MQNRHDRLRAVLTRAFEPSVLDISDQSARHAGHSGAAAGGETHYDVLVVAPAFAAMSRVDRSRAVHAALADEFASGLHAISLTLRSPIEQARQGTSQE